MPPLVLAFSIRLIGKKADLKPCKELLCQGIAPPIRGSVWCLSMFCVFTFYRTTIIVKL